MKLQKPLNLLAAMVATAVGSFAMMPRPERGPGYWPSGTSRPPLGGRLSPRRWEQSLKQARGHVAAAKAKRDRKRARWGMFCAHRDGMSKVGGKLVLIARDIAEPLDVGASL